MSNFMGFAGMFGVNPIGDLRYVTPCQSNKFNEQGTPIGYYVDAFGKEFSQEEIDGSKGCYDTNHDPVENVIDVTFEEVE